MADGVYDSGFFANGTPRASAAFYNTDNSVRFPSLAGLPKATLERSPSNRSALRRSFIWFRFVHMAVSAGLFAISPGAGILIHTHRSRPTAYYAFAIDLASYGELCLRPVTGHLGVES